MVCWGLLCKQCLPSIRPGRYAVAPHAAADRRLAFTSHLLRHVGAPIACVLHGWLRVSKSASAIYTWARIHPRVREAGSAHQPLCTKQSCCETPQSANRAACSDHNMSTLSIAVWEGRTAVDATSLWSPGPRRSLATTVFKLWWCSCGWSTRFRTVTKPCRGKEQPFEAHRSDWWTIFKC